MLGKRPLPPSGGWYFFSRVELPVPLFLQGDPAWGQDQSGSGQYTLGQVGCAITSSAMVMKFYGIDTDPGRLNVFLRDHDGFDENNDLRWEGPAALAPDRVRHAYEDLPSYYLIDSNLYRGNPVIVRLHLASGWTHFVVVMGKQGFDYLIRDPSPHGLTKGRVSVARTGQQDRGVAFLRTAARTPVNNPVAGDGRPGRADVSAFATEGAKGGVRFGGQPPGLLTRALQAQDGGIGRFLRGEVLARALAEFFARLRHVENVVDDLKRQAERAAEARQRLPDGRAWRSRSSPPKRMAVVSKRRRLALVDVAQLLSR